MDAKTQLMMTFKKVREICLDIAKSDIENFEKVWILTGAIGILMFQLRIYTKKNEQIFNHCVAEVCQISLETFYEVGNTEEEDD